MVLEDGRLSVDEIAAHHAPSHLGKRGDMMAVELDSLSYQGKQGQVEWHGLHLKDGDAFDAFLSKDVAARLHDAEGAEDFETHLRGLAGTDFARDGLAAILAADIPEERDWAVGEAIAEAHLQQAHNLVWPWNMERDKRTPRASLPGADLVGFQVQGNAVRTLSALHDRGPSCSRLRGQVMSHRLLDQIDKTRQQALRQASRAQIHREFLDQPLDENTQLIARTVDVLELAALDMLLEGRQENDENQRELRLCAADAFRLMRALPRPSDPLEATTFLLRAGALAVLGDKGADAARFLTDEAWPLLPLATGDWRARTWATILDVWLRLIRKSGWSDRDAVLEGIARLRDSQATFEQEYLKDQDPVTAKAVALELIGLYHLAKAAEVFAFYMTDGVVDGKYQIHQLLDTHFDRALAVCGHAQLFDLEPLTRLLAACAAQMAENSN